VAEHSLLLEVVSGLRTRINRFLFEAAGLLPPTNLEAHINTHDVLIDVLKEGNIANAQDEMTRHVLAATERIMTYCNFSHYSDKNGDGKEFA
ncbi:MAG: FCD domain-containing protein, partial [Candidatus Eremiobacteraeota bacterium]|nr:FCD domain-containing protein [Candidatus Eremiobacteraeota bacterium]